MLLVYFFLLKIDFSFKFDDVFRFMNPKITSKHSLISVYIFYIYSLGPLETLPREMVSRRKILSRSRDDLNLEHQYQQQDDEEDIWYQKDKLYKVSASRFFCVVSIETPKTESFLRIAVFSSLFCI